MTNKATLTTAQTTPPTLPDTLAPEQQRRVRQQHRPHADVPQRVENLRRERALLEEDHPAASRFLPLYEYFTTLRWRSNMDARFVAVGDDPEEVSFWKPSLDVRTSELTDASGYSIPWPNHDRERYYEAIRTDELTEDNAYLSAAAWYVATERDRVLAAFQSTAEGVEGLDVSLKAVPNGYATMKPLNADWTFNRQGDYYRFRVAVETPRALEESRPVVERYFNVLPRQRPDLTAREIVEGR